MKQTNRFFRPEESIQIRGQCVRTVRDDVELDVVYRMAHEAYLHQGYCAPTAPKRLNLYPSLDGIEETRVWVLDFKGTIQASVSVTQDGPKGLPMECGFGGLYAGVRLERRRLGAVWRMVKCSAAGALPNPGLIMVTTALTDAFCNRNLETFFCSVHPKHESFYRRVLKMRRVGFSRDSEGLQNAPAVLMRCDIESLPEKWLRSRQRQPETRIVVPNIKSRS